MRGRAGFQPDPLQIVQKCREISDFTALTGGLEGIRTLDLSDANRTLSQLSYEPILRYFVVFGACRTGNHKSGFFIITDFFPL